MSQRDELVIVTTKTTKRSPRLAYFDYFAINLSSLVESCETFERGRSNKDKKSLDFARRDDSPYKPPRDSRRRSAKACP